MKKEGTPAWTEIDELGFKIGDMHGEWEKSEKPKQPVPTKPIRRRRIPEVLKHHIKKTGK